MEQVEGFRYLGSDIYETSRMNKKISHRVKEGERVGGALKVVWRNNCVLKESMK